MIINTRIELKAFLVLLYIGLVSSLSAQVGNCNDPVPLTCGTAYNGTTVTGGQQIFNSYSCTGNQQEAEKEKVHTISFSQASDITATLTNLNGVDLDVHILSSCSSTSCLARGDNSATANGLGAGTYYIIVDGYTGAGNAPSGSYTLTVTCNTSSSTQGTCGAPISLTCGTSYSGNTSNGASNFNTYSCGAQAEGGKEMVHVIGLTTPGTLTATLSNLNGVDLDVHILSACSASACIARDNTSATASGLSVGTYYIVVDGYTGGGQMPEGAYDLIVNCTPSSSGGNAGTCGDPIPLTCGTPFTGTTADGLSNFNVYSCDTQQEAEKEKIHTIVLTQTSNITATLSNLNGVDLDVHILSSCSANSCIARGDNSATATALAAGTYYVVVDGFTGLGGSPSGAYTLDVSCTSNNTTGTCSSPIPLTCGTDYSGSTQGFPNNFSNYNCSSFDKIGPEVIHVITSPGNGNLSVTLTRPSGVDLEIGILSACDANSCLDITTASLGTSITSSISNAVAGQQYFIVVDGDEAVDIGAYTVNVNCPVPSTIGDCNNPISLTCGTPYSGTTTDGQSNFNVYSCDTQQEEGKEKIHTITLTQTSDITATLSNLNGVDLDVHILSACNATSCLSRGDNAATATSLAAGTYYIVVDGFGPAPSVEGAYTLTLSCTPTVGGSDTGTCNDPVALTCGTSYTGTTVNGLSNFDSYTCGVQQEEGKEKIHTITLTQTSDITATLSSLNGVDLDVHILSACNTSSCLSRGDNSTTATSLAAGTYYIVVDGYGAAGVNEGAYTLSATCTPTSGINDAGTCGDPIALTCGTPYSGTTTNGQSNFDVYSCGAQQEEGKEKIHTIVLTQPSDIIATLSGMAVDLDVHILSACNTASCIARDNSSASATNLAAGTYYIVVDGFGPAPSVEGAYTINVSCTPTSSGCTPNNVTDAQSVCQGSTYQFGTQSLTTGGTYSETFTNVGGCDSVVTLTLTENPLPTISAGTDMTVSAGTAVTLSGAGGVSYTWDNGVVDGSSFTASATMTYTVTGTDANGCQNQDNITVTVNGGGTQGCSELFFSEYIEGSSNNKAIEIYNPSAGTINLSAYAIEIYANGASAATTTIPLTGSIASNATFVIANASSNSSILGLATMNSAQLTYNGDDAVALVKSSTQMVDLIGKIGEDPGSDWVGGSVSTKDMTLVRMTSVQGGVLTNPSTFDPSTEWNASAQDVITNLGAHTSNCSNGGSCDETVNVSETICSGSSYILGTQTLTTAGTYTETLQNAAGCDSVVNLTLAVEQAYTTNSTETVCGASYVFGSQTLTQNGVYTETLQSMHGCDSTVTLNITFEDVRDSTFVVEICQGESYVLGTQTLTQSGAYSEVFTTSNGCDSTVNLTLSVKATPIITVTENNGDLISSIGNDYQWSYNGSVIQGETNQNITPSQNGVYSVVTTAFNGCSATGSFNMLNVTISEALNESNIFVMPNPTKGNFTVSSNSKVEVIIYNLIGKIVYSNVVYAKSHSVDLSDKDRGVYMVKIIGENNSYVVKRIILN